MRCIALWRQLTILKQLLQLLVKEVCQTARCRDIKQ